MGHTRHADSDVRALVRVTGLPLAHRQAAGACKEFSPSRLLLAFDREALIHDSMEARNVLINHGFPDGGLILAVFSRVV